MGSKYIKMKDFEDRNRIRTQYIVQKQEFIEKYMKTLA